MKAKISLTTFLIVSVSLSFITSIALAKGIYDDWAYAINDGNVPVILHVKTGENKYTEIQLEPGKAIVLPAGSQKVTAFPVKGRLEEGERMGVETNLFTSYFNGPVESITEPGKSVKFPRPSIAMTPQMRKSMKGDIAFAPGALAPAEEEQVKQETPIDDKEFLREQNKMYMDKKKRLEEIDPDSAEAKMIRGALKVWEKDIDGMAKQAEAKYGPDWKERYRDSNGKLPGGFIEDDKSKLVNLQERRKEQQDKVNGLKSAFEDLKKRLQPVESRWEDRLTKDQREFREKFLEEHGPSDTWDEDARKKYEEGFNELTKKSRKQWEKDKADQAEVNRGIGRKIKEIAQEQAELNEMDKAIELQKKRIAKKASTAPAIPSVTGKNAGTVKPPSPDSNESKKRVPSAQVTEPALTAAQVTELALKTAKSSLTGVAFIEGYAEDQTDGTIGYWDSKYPHPSFDDEEGRLGNPNGAWDGSYYFEGNKLYLVINNLHAEWPPLHTLNIGYTVTLNGWTFEDGSVTKNLILYTYSGTPSETRIVKGFNVKRNR